MALTPDCLAHIGLQTDPFAATPEEAAVYRDALLDGTGELALRALVQPGALLVLAGPSGVGRSIQLQQILSLLADEIELIAFRARPRIGFEAVDATIRFHLSELGSKDPSASLLSLMDERLRAGQTLLLAIDDAHLIAAPVLEQLFELRRQLLEQQGSTTRFFLVGDPAFAANPLPGLSADEDTRVLRMHLRAFNREQTRAYLIHRLRSAGYPQPEQLLRHEVVEHLHETSNGLPKYLNVLATDWLEELCDQHGQEHPPASPNSPASEEAVVSAMTALEALRNASRDALNPSKSKAAPKSVQTAGQERKPAAPEEPAEDGAAKSTQSKPPPVKKSHKDPAQRGNKRKAAGRKAQATPVNHRVPIWNRPWFVPGMAMFSLVAILVPLLWQLPGSEKDARTSGLNQTLSPRVRPPVAPGTPLVAPTLNPSDPGGGSQGPRELQVPAILSGTSDTESVTEGTTTNPSADLRPSPTQNPENPAGAQPADTSAKLDGDWILRQPAQHFTIQLVAARTEAAARQYAQQVRGMDLHFVPIRSKSQNFIIVLAGVYPARDQAERALERLPAELRERGYWIRSIDSVRQSLRTP
jgi:DamX protein